VAGWQSDRAWDDGAESYRGMVEISRRILAQSQSGEDAAARVISGFPEVPPWFRALFPYSVWGAKLNARITPAFFRWLVGPCEPTAVEIETSPGVVEEVESGVLIRRCRYLAESGCKGMCVALCKTPTQRFFTEQLGMPLTMTPNFETLECTMAFGRAPPADVLADEVSRQACWGDCPSALPELERCQNIGP